MLLRCRSTVRSLRTSSAAMALLVCRRRPSGAPPAHARSAYPPLQRLPSGKATLPGSGPARRRAAGRPSARHQAPSPRCPRPPVPCGQPDNGPDTRRLVRHLEALPGRPRIAQRHQGGVRVVFRQEAEGQPERAPGSSLRVAPAQELVMRTRPDVGAVVVPADQVGGYREPLEIVWLERDPPVRGRQLGVRVRPRLSPEGRPALIECVGHRHIPSRRPGVAALQGAVTRSPRACLKPYRPAGQQEERVRWRRPTLPRDRPPDLPTREPATAGRRTDDTAVSSENALGQPRAAVETGCVAGWRHDAYLGSPWRW